MAAQPPATWGERVPVYDNGDPISGREATIIGEDVLSGFRALLLGAKPPRLVHDFSPPLDEAARVARDKTLFEMGVILKDEAYWGETNGGKWVQKEKTPTSPTPAFAASAGTHTPMHGEAMKFSAAGLGQMVSA